MIRKIVKTTNSDNNNDMANPKGMYWNGTRYVKSKPGAYDGTEMYQNGGRKPPAGSRLSDRQTSGLFETITYPGDTLTDNQLRPARNNMVGNTVFVPDQGTEQYRNLSVYTPSTKDMQKMKKLGYNVRDIASMGDYRMDDIPAPNTYIDRNAYNPNQYMHGGNIEVPYTGGMPKLNYGGVLGKQYANPNYTHVTALMRDGGQVGRGIGNPNYTHVTALMEDGGIHISPSKVGSFTRAAESRGQGVQQFASQVIANPGSYSEAMRKKAQFAHNAAGWGKKQYGGPTRYDIGGVTDENPMGGATTFTGQNPAGSSTTNPGESSYDAGADPNNPVNQNIPMPQQGGYEAAQPGTWDETGITDTQPEPESVQQPSQQMAPIQQRRPLGTGYRNLLGAAMIYGQAAADRRQAKSMKAYGIQQGMTSMNATSQPFSKGQYNQQGQLQQQFQPVGRFGRYGGNMNSMPRYEMGGEYELTDAEIQKLQAGGYKLKMC